MIESSFGNAPFLRPLQELNDTTLKSVSTLNLEHSNLHHPITSFSSIIFSMI